MVRLGIISIVVVLTSILGFVSVPSPPSHVPPPFIQTSPQKGNWRLVPAPTKSNLVYVAALTTEKAYALGQYMLEFDGTSWRHLPSQPRLEYALQLLFVLDSKNVWLTTPRYTFESVLFHYDGATWRTVDHPLANQIDAMWFGKDGTAWLGGDREVAYFDGRRWEFIPHPPSFEAIQSVQGDGRRSAWVVTTGRKLFRYSNGNWREYLLDHSVRAITFGQDEYWYALAGNVLYRWKDSAFALFGSHEALAKVSDFTVLASGEVWGIGPKGLIVHFDGIEWDVVPPPTHSNLNAIHMLSPTEGWIVGDDGIILRLSAESTPTPHVPAFGFEQLTIVPIGKAIDDEYGVAIEDFDNDGWNDVYSVCIYQPNRLYVNRMGRSRSEGVPQQLLFREQAAPRGVTGSVGTTSAVDFSEILLGVGVADINNNGAQDLYLCNLAGPNRLFLNDGSGSFRNVTHQRGRGQGESERTNVAIFGDVDNDGNLDLFITNEYSTNRLFLGRGNGYFIEVTEQAGLVSQGGGMGAMFADIDGDGDLDLFVGNWSLSNRLYRNETTREDGVRFIDITGEAGVGGDPTAKTNGVVFADLDNDSDLDLFVTNRKQSNRLYLNDGRGQFTDVTVEYLGLDTMASYGASAADFDSDGYLDLYVANVGENVLFKNVGGKRFRDATLEFGVRLGGYSTGTATGDVDNDGDIDLYVANYIGSSSMLYLNKADNSRYVMVDVVGTRSNRDGIGAKVWLYRAGGAEDSSSLIGFREIHSGSGYASRSARTAHFGVNTTDRYNVVVQFPASGIKRVVHDVPAGSRITVMEEEGRALVATRMTNALRRWITDPEYHIEAAKVFVVGLLLLLSGLRGSRRYRWKLSLQVGIHGSVFGAFILQMYLFRFEPFHISTLLPIASVLTVLVIIHLLYERVVLVRRAKQERQETRDRIARDLHDDVASTLGSAVIYVDSLSRSLKVSESEMALLSKVRSLLAEASEMMTEIVWTVSPQHDTLKDLILRLRLLIMETCRTYGLGVHLETTVGEGDEALAEISRRSIYLIFKEGLNNIVKHANARNIRFTARIQDAMLTISLEDDGVGVHPAFVNERPRPQVEGEMVEQDPFRGHGLQNMRRRAEEIGGELEIVSSPGKGTRISLMLKMT